MRREKGGGVGEDEWSDEREREKEGRTTQSVAPSCCRLALRHVRRVPFFALACMHAWKLFFLLSFLC